MAGTGSDYWSSQGGTKTSGGTGTDYWAANGGGRAAAPKTGGSHLGLGDVLGALPHGISAGAASLVHIGGAGVAGLAHFGGQALQEVQRNVGPTLSSKPLKRPEGRTKTEQLEYEHPLTTTLLKSFGQTGEHAVHPTTFMQDVHREGWAPVVLNDVANLSMVAAPVAKVLAPAAEAAVAEAETARVTAQGARMAGDEAAARVADEAAKQAARKASLLAMPSRVAVATEKVAGAPFLPVTGAAKLAGTVAPKIVEAAASRFPDATASAQAAARSAVEHVKTGAGQLAEKAQLTENAREMHRIAKAARQEEKVGRFHIVAESQAAEKILGGNPDEIGAYHVLLTEEAHPGGGLDVASRRLPADRAAEAIVNAYAERGEQISPRAAEIAAGVMRGDPAYAEAADRIRAATEATAPMRARREATFREVNPRGAAEQLGTEVRGGAKAAVEQKYATKLDRAEKRAAKAEVAALKKGAKRVLSPEELAKPTGSLRTFEARALELADQMIAEDPHSAVRAAGLPLTAPVAATTLRETLAGRIRMELARPGALGRSEARGAARLAGVPGAEAAQTGAAQTLATALTGEPRTNLPVSGASGGAAESVAARRAMAEQAQREARRLSTEAERARNQAKLRTLRIQGVEGLGGAEGRQVKVPQGATRALESATVRVERSRVRLSKAVAQAAGAEQKIATGGEVAGRAAAERELRDATKATRDANRTLRRQIKDEAFAEAKKIETDLTDQAGHPAPPPEYVRIGGQRVPSAMTDAYRTFLEEGGAAARSIVHSGKFVERAADFEDFLAQSYRYLTGEDYYGGAAGANVHPEEAAALVGRHLAEARQLRDSARALVRDGTDELSAHSLGARLGLDEETSASLIGPLEDATARDLSAARTIGVAQGGEQGAMTALGESGTRVAEALDHDLHGLGTRDARAELNPAERQLYDEYAARASHVGAEQALAEVRTATAKGLLEAGRRQGQREGVLLGAPEARARLLENLAESKRVRASRLTEATPEGAAVRAEGRSRLLGQGMGEGIRAGRVETEARQAERVFGIEARRYQKLSAARQAELTALETDLKGAPARYRPVMVTNRAMQKEVLGYASDLRRQGLHAAADIIEEDAARIPTVLKDLVDAGVDPTHLIGGLPRERGPGASQARVQLPGQPKMRAERYKAEKATTRSIKGQAKLEIEELRKVVQRHAADTLVEKFGHSGADIAAVAGDPTLSGSTLAAVAHDAGLKAFDPANIFSTVKPENVTAETVFIPEELHRSFPKQFEAHSGLMAEVNRWVLNPTNRALRASVLYLNPAYYVHRAAVEVIMAGAGGQLPHQFLGQWREAARQVRAGTAEPAVLRAGGGAQELNFFEEQGAPRTPVGKAIRAGAKLSSFMADTSHVAFMLAEEAKGASHEAAVDAANKWMGDLEAMRPAERNIIRPLFPFYSFARHISTVAAHLAVEHPARVAWTLHLISMFTNPDERSGEHVGEVETSPGHWVRLLPGLNPFRDVALLSAPFNNKGAAIGRSFGPVLRTAVNQFPGSPLYGHDLIKPGAPAIPRPGFEGPFDKYGRQLPKPVPLLKQLENEFGGNLPKLARTGIAALRGQKPIQRYPSGEPIEPERPTGGFLSEFKYATGIPAGYTTSPQSQRAQIREPLLRARAKARYEQEKKVHAHRG